MNTELPILAEIYELSKPKVHPLKVRNVYVYGSRVYGSNRPDSDFDIVMVAGHMLPHEEIKSEKYNIHIHTPDKFKADLLNYKMYALECFFAPDWAKVLIKESYRDDFSLNEAKFKQSILTQSSNTWSDAKYKFQTGDIHKGLKTGFHALKVLQFGIQILDKGWIYDFGANNDLLLEIKNSEFYDWKPFKEKYLPLKIELEEKFKKAELILEPAPIPTAFGVVSGDMKKDKSKN